jgi:flagellar motor switch protein FliM
MRAGSSMGTNTLLIIGAVVLFAIIDFILGAQGSRIFYAL